MDEQSRESLGAEIDSANDVIKKLRNFANELVKTSGNNILTHLCDGLETFLGFNSASKGYTGTGIVYSDLDRLCDGVMGFLSGVLGAVKNENEVTTYDNYMTDRLESVLKLVDSKIGSGSKALAVSVDAVKGWLEGYWNTLWSMTHNVTNELNEVIKSIYSVHKRNVDDRKSYTLVKQLEAWNGTVGNISTQISVVEMNVKNLDHQLRSMLEKDIHPIKKVIEHMKKVMADGSFNGQVRKVDETLVNQKTIMLNKVNEESRRVRTTVENIVDEIVKKIKDIADNKKKYFQGIKETLKDATEFMDNGFDKEYRSRIIGVFHDIKKEVTIVHDNLLADKGRLAGLVEQARSELGTLNEKVKGGAKDCINTSWFALKDTITTLVGNVAIMTRTEGSLVDIVEGVRDYAKHFPISGQFDQHVQKWVESALKDADLSRYLSLYVKANPDSLGGAKKDAQAVKVAIKNAVPNIIKTSVQSAVGTAGIKEVTVERIVGKLNTFSKNVNTELTSQEKTRTIISSALHDIEEALGVKSIAKSNLEYAVESILRFVAESASLLALEINRFVITSKINTKLNEAIGKIKEIGDNISTDHDANRSGKKIDEGLKAVGVQIQRLENVLSTKSGTLHMAVESLETQLLKELKHIQEYDGIIDTYNKGADKKITELRTQLTALLENIESVVMSGDDALNKVIKLARNAISDANSKINNAISELTRNILQKVEDTFSVLSTDIGNLFASGHKADLVALAELVNSQKQAIEEIIKVDKGNGVKGLLKWLYKHKGKNLEDLKINTSGHIEAKDLAKIFRGLCTKFRLHVDVILPYLEYQVRSPNKPTTTESDTSKVHEIHNNMTKLLDYVKNDEATADPRNGHIKRIYIFDEHFTQLLSHLSSSVSALSPNRFHGYHNPLLLDVVKRGMEQFTEELQKAYINKYEGSQAINWKETESNDGVNCAKILLSWIEDWDLHLSYLNDKCGSEWSQNRIKLDIQNEKNNMCGLWFKCRGYRVSTTDKQDGELRSNDQSTGGKLKTCCDNTLTLDTNLAAILNKVDIKITGNKTTHLQLLRYLYDRLDKYRRVCHLRHIPGAKPPTTVNQMLHWCAGLQWHPMFNKLNAYIPKWFDAVTEDYKLGKKEFNVAAPHRVSWSMRATINVGNLKSLFNSFLIRPYKILVAIQGHGQAEGRYAVDFHTNPDDLLYPSRESECFDMLIDVAFRMHDQLRFLLTQCHNDENSSGWLNCHYGKEVGGSAWNCNTTQCANQTCPQRADQKGKQKADQTCDQHPMCGVKSPLQSYLEDGLPGFLPHQFKTPGCKLECTYSNHRGIPCRTPMGFRNIGSTASHTKTGKHLKDVLDKFCGDAAEALSMLCGYLICLQRRPPQTLGDMFAFYHNYLENWSGRDGVRSKSKEHKVGAFNQAVQDANFGRSYDGLNPTKLQKSVIHVDGSHTKGDLFSLIDCEPESTAIPPCGQYLQPFTRDTRCMFYGKQAGLYLSWIVYITETFWSLLNKLYDECRKNCSAGGSQCFAKSCTKTCSVKYTDEKGESTSPQPNTQHEEGCKSIMKCLNTHPTLYTYGFTFGSPYKMSAAGNYKKQKRTCKDFCQALKITLDKESPLIQLIKAADEFLWAIRTPFSYLVLALWSLSLFYLICVMVGRLDVLHIRSHLRSPSSHRITAQSLLAAAQVGRLAKISYLQP